MSAIDYIDVSLCYGEDRHARAIDYRIEIRVISEPAFVATKLEAFIGRGRGDFLSVR